MLRDGNERVAGYDSLDRADVYMQVIARKMISREIPLAPLLRLKKKSQAFKSFILNIFNCIIPLITYDSVT